MAEVKVSKTEEAAASAQKAAEPRKPAPAVGKHSVFARVNRWQRLVIQIIFLVLAPQTFSLAFAGVKQLFVSLGKLDVFEANTFLILLIVLLAFTVVFGRFFCGYICAFGTVGDILYKVVDFPLAKLHIKRPTLPDKAENVLRFLKYAVLAFFIVTSVVGLSSAVSVYSPWTAFGRLLSANFLELNVVGLALLVIIAIGMICKERFFCEYLCPMGALFSLLPMLPFFRARRHLPTCDNCGACKRNCPMNVIVPNDGALAGECISCGRCAPVCPHQCVGMCSDKALAARLEAAVSNDDAVMAAGNAQGERQPDAKPQLVWLKAQTPLVIVLAAVLLAVFAALGIVSPLFM